MDESTRGQVSRAHEEVTRGNTQNKYSERLARNAFQEGDELALERQRAAEEHRAAMENIQATWEPNTSFEIIPDAKHLSMNIWNSFNYAGQKGTFLRIEKDRNGSWWIDVAWIFKQKGMRNRLSGAYFRKYARRC